MAGWAANCAAVSTACAAASVTAPAVGPTRFANTPVTSVADRSVVPAVNVAALATVTWSTPIGQVSAVGAGIDGATPEAVGQVVPVAEVAHQPGAVALDRGDLDPVAAGQPSARNTPVPNSST